jgi:hypothetical protein
VVAGSSEREQWTRAWSEEIARRMNELVDDRVGLLDADDVHRELRADLRVARRRIGRRSNRA